MEAFFTALFIVVFFALVFIFIGFFLISRLVGGLGNLKALYRLFTGHGKQNVRQGSAKSSSSGGSSHTYNNKGKASGGDAQKDGKMFGQNEGTYVEFEEVKE